MVIVQLIHDDRELYRDYAAPQPRFGPAPDALLRGLSVIPGITVHVVSCLQQPVSSPARLASNIHYHTLHVPKLGWLRTGYQGCVRAVRRFLRQLKPDIVHGQGTERDCAVSATFSGWPNVITIHGNMRALAAGARARMLSFGWLQALLEGIVLPRTGGVFCNSEHTENLVSPLARRVWRVPNALNPVFFSPLPKPSRAPFLLNVGGILPNKRQVELLELAARLHARGVRFRLGFLGRLYTNEPYGRRFHELVRVAEAAGYASYLGAGDLKTVVQHLDAASALVHVPAEEAFGLAVAEALARNLKLFGFGVGGVRDIALGVEAAELVAPGDWTALGNSIESWIKIGCPRPGAAADCMRKRYHPEVVAQQHLEVYRKFLGA